MTVPSYIIHIFNSLLLGAIVMALHEIIAFIHFRYNCRMVISVWRWKWGSPFLTWCYWSVIVSTGYIVRSLIGDL